MITKYKCFSKLKPKAIKIVDTKDFDAKVSGRHILISKIFLEKGPSQKEIEDLLKHELIHCVYPKYGHSIEFINLARRLKTRVSDYEWTNLIDELNKTVLEGRISYYINERGEEVVKIRRSPSWRGFKELLEDQYFHAGEALKMLRKRCSVSRRELAEKVAISEYKLRQIEEDKDDVMLYTSEPLLRKIFYEILKLEKEVTSSKK